MFTFLLLIIFDYEINNKVLFIGLFITSSSIKANDTLKVKKGRFFVEPKMVFYVLIQKSGTSVSESYLISHPIACSADGYYKETINR